MKLLVSALSAIFLFTGCNSGYNKEAALQNAKQMAIDSMQNAISKQAAIDSMNEVMAQQEDEMKVQHEKELALMKEEKSKEVVVNNAPAPVAKKKKKKWNNTAKGAVIGAGTGAIAGTLIDKNHGEGAIIGTLVGAGVGTATGAVIDGSKKKKKENQ